MSDYVRYEQEGDVAVLTMDDGKANAFGINMTTALMDGLDRASAEAGAVVLAGRPGVLCAGFDLSVIRGGDPEKKTAMRNAGVEALLRLYMHPQPLVIACTGHAVAAGALILLTGDRRIGAAGAFKIGLNEIAIGMTLPIFGLELARDRLDPRALNAAVLGATIYDPAGATAAGYLDQVEDPDALLVESLRVAQEMTALDAAAYGATKALLRGETVAKIRATMPV
jgi:enoyl-CoA hydratase